MKWIGLKCFVNILTYWKEIFFPLVSWDWLSSITCGLLARKDCSSDVWWLNYLSKEKFRLKSSNCIFLMRKSHLNPSRFDTLFGSLSTGFYHSTWKRLQKYLGLKFHASSWKKGVLWNSKFHSSSRKKPACLHKYGVVFINI